MRNNGPAKRFFESAVSYLPQGTLARIDAQRSPIETRSEMTRRLIMESLERREAKRQYQSPNLTAK